MPSPQRLLIISALVFHASVPPHATAQADFKRLSIEELMRIDVTTATRRAEPIATTPAAITVLTGDDIRRSGLTTIADVLQLADGVHVARSSGSAWSISARGFNGSTPNKLLVMIDGRTMNSSLFTGVFWNVLDYVLEDIDRIEIIRGPGAALWGANAVNGVVNIITRHSRDTQGAYLLLSTGMEHPALVTARHGGRAGASATWRVYGKFAAHSNQELASGQPSQDARQRGQIGVRLDGGDRDGTYWAVKADAFRSSESVANRADARYTDVGVQANWSRPLSTTSRVNLQTYYRREYREVPGQLTHHINVFDVEAQHASTVALRHSLLFGGGVRVSADGTQGTASLSFDPEDRTMGLTNVFAQDDIAVVPDRLYVTLGAKFEHNAFSGGEFQPNVRGRLILPRNQTLWGAVARAIRRPTRIDDDVFVRNAAGVVTLRGSDDFLPESLVAAEAGYRVQVSQFVSVDATVFRHNFDDLRSQEAPLAPGEPIVLGNTLAGTSQGIELGFNFQPAPWWRGHASYTGMDTSFRRQPGSRDLSNGASEANDPNHLFGLRSSFDLARNVELDFSLRGVGELEGRGVPGYTELNVRIGWQRSPRTELWFAGQDLLHGSHPELGPSVATRIEMQRALRVGMALRF